MKIYNDYHSAKMATKAKGYVVRIGCDYTAHRTEETARKRFEKAIIGIVNEIVDPDGKIIASY